MSFAKNVAGVRLGVIIPAFRVADQIEEVLHGVPDWVTAIIVVEDASPDETAQRVQAVDDPRITLLQHEENQGVGGAMVTGFKEALRQRLDVIVKMDGDGQMDPAQLPNLLSPILTGRADMTKGNRYHNLSALRQMPAGRIAGNAGLTFLVKLASGYWNMFDPTNGYFAIRASVLGRLDLDKLPRRYFFESGFLIHLGVIGAMIKDVPIDARYGEESSSLSIWKTLVEFPPRLVWGLLRRLFWRYLVYDFTAVSLLMIVGVPTFLWGVWRGLAAFARMRETGVPASAGTVMIAAIPIILGFQLVLQAVVVDIGNVPSEPLSPPLDRNSSPGASESGDG